MKRILSIILAALLLVCLGASAFASSGGTGNGDVHEGDTGSVPVQGEYVTPAATETIYVSMTWSGMSFTYTPAHKGGWKPETHEYETDVAAEWKSSDGHNYGTITFKNESAYDVTDNLMVKLEFSPNTEISGTVQMKFSLNDDFSSELANRANNYQNIAILPSNKGNDTPTIDVYVKPGIGPTVTEFPNNSLGTIKVTIAREIISDPGLPEPGIESVQPAPEAGEIAANG